MPLITISGTPINFPDTGNSPVWSDAVIQFAQTVAQVLNGIAGPFDINPQVYNMVANLNTNVDIPGLQFPVSNVRSANIRYDVSRSTNSTSVYEAGNILIDYNPLNPTGNKWAISQDLVGDAQITFAISDTGQFSFSTTTIAGSNHVGQISFAATTLTVE